MARWLQSTVQGMLNAELKDPSIPVTEASFHKSGDARDYWTETVVAASETISLTWHDIGDPLLIHTFPNTGPDARTWWWYRDTNGSTIQSHLDANSARLPTAPASPSPLGCSKTGFPPAHPASSEWLWSRRTRCKYDGLGGQNHAHSNGNRCFVSERTFANPK